VAIIEINEAAAMSSRVKLPIPSMPRIYIPIDRFCENLLNRCDVRIIIVE
jgi:hypothetical protein